MCYLAISDDPSRQDDRQIGRFDLATGELTPVTDWDGYYRGTLFGVWQAENKLLFTRRSVAADCPYEPVISHYTISNWEQLDPWVSITLYALDPHTGEETALLTEKASSSPGGYRTTGSTGWTAKPTRSASAPSTVTRPRRCRCRRRLCRLQRSHPT